MSFSLGKASVHAEPQLPLGIKCNYKNPSLSLLMGRLIFTDVHQTLSSFSLVTSFLWLIWNWP
jgi:hypothetical protein